MKRDYYSDSFFNPHELTKKALESSTKFYGVKLFLLFFRVTYNTGRDQMVTPFRFFFRHYETFFSKKIPKGPLSIFLMVCDKMDVEKSQIIPPLNFFGIVRLFGGNFLMRLRDKIVLPRKFYKILRSRQIVPVGPSN